MGAHLEDLRVFCYGTALFVVVQRVPKDKSNVVVRV